MATMNKLRAEMAQRFLDALNQGQLPWRACWQQGRPVNAVTGKLYKGVNAFWLSYMADQKGYTDPRWCTYYKAEEKGWQVRKGEKACRVEYWAYYDPKKKKLLSWNEAYKLIKDDPEYAKKLQLRCRIFSVFNAEQIDGIPELQIQQNHTDIGALRLQRDTLLRNMAIGYEEHGDRAYYSPFTDTVTLPPEGSFDDPYAYMCTFLHECGHGTGHASRLNRDLSGMRGSESYAREELRAEIASAFTAQALGLQLTDEQLKAHMDLHTAYIQGWAAHLKDAPEELFRAIKAAEEISDYLIEKGEFELDHLQNTQLFKTNTVQQRKIMEWLVAQGITSEDIQSAELSGPAMVRLTNPEGQYMDVYCDTDNAVRILQITAEREEELQSNFWEETNEPESQEWREVLTDDESAMVEQWDIQTAQGFSRLAQAVLDRNDGTVQYTLSAHPDGHGMLLWIHGHGAIPDFIDTAARPFQSHVAQIREVVIEEGITAVGKKALSDLPALEKIRWARTAQQVVQLATDNCPNLKEIEYFGELPSRKNQRHIIAPSELMELSMRYPKMTREQLAEIANGIRDGLSQKQIDQYAKSIFSPIQMNSIHYSIINGLTTEQIDLQANPAFDSVQMDIIRSSFQAGLTMEQVKVFARPEISAPQMLEAYWAAREGRSRELPQENIYGYDRDTWNSMSEGEQENIMSRCEYDLQRPDQADWGIEEPC